MEKLPEEATLPAKMAHPRSSAYLLFSDRNFDDANKKLSAAADPLDYVDDVQKIRAKVRTGAKGKPSHGLCFSNLIVGQNPAANGVIDAEVGGEPSTLYIKLPFVADI
jgi:hypothetical protein